MVISDANLARGGYASSRNYGDLECRGLSRVMLVAFPPCGLCPPWLVPPLEGRGYVARNVHIYGYMTAGGTVMIAKAFS